MYDPPQVIECFRAADDAARRGVDVFAVAISSNVDDQQLFDIVGGIPGRVFSVEKFSHLRGVSPQLFLLERPYYV